jgi:hypothetical protein
MNDKEYWQWLGAKLLNNMLDEQTVAGQIMDSFTKRDNEFVLNHISKLTAQGQQHFQKLLDKGNFEKAARQMGWFFPIECNDRVPISKFPGGIIYTENSEGQN